MPPGINFFAFSLTGAKDVSPSLAILTTNVQLDYERRKTKEEKKERRRLLGITDTMCRFLVDYVGVATA